MSNIIKKPSFPSGLEAEDSILLQAGAVNNGLIEHGETAVLQVPSGVTEEQIDPSAVRYNPETDEFQGSYQEGWRTLGGGGVLWRMGEPENGIYKPVTGRGYFIDSREESAIVDLPTDIKNIGVSISFADLYGNLSMYPMTIRGNGNKVYGALDDMVIHTDNSAFTFTWTGEDQGWIVTSAVGFGSGRTYRRNVIEETLTEDTDFLETVSVPEMVDIYIDGKRLPESQYTLKSDGIEFKGTISAGSLVLVLEYKPVNLGTGSDIVIEDRTLYEVARANNVSLNEVTLADVGTSLHGFKVIYDKDSQRSYFLPGDISDGSTLTSLVDGILTTSVTSYDLGKLAVQREDWAKITENFTSGFTLKVANEVVLFEGNLYRWGGSFPKVVVAESSLETTGSITVNTWQPIDTTSLRGSFKGNLSDVITWVTPEIFGAKGDGVSDDTAPIQTAIDYMASIGGGDVRFGPKEYRADNIVLKDFVRLKGESIMNSRIKARDGWTGLAVIATEDFDAFRAAGLYGGGDVKGTWGAVVDNLAIDGNYQNFAGTASISSGHGLCMAGWSNYVDNIDIKWCAGTGLVKMSKTGIPEAYPDNKTDYTNYACHDISVMYCGNDAMVTLDHDQVYGNILIGLFAYDLAIEGSGLDGPSFWDTSRRCAGWYARNVVDVDQVHIYGGYVGYGLVVGDTDDTIYPTRFQYGRMIIESVMIAVWFRPTSYCMGGEIDCHDISQNIAVPAHASYDPYPPAVIIESGLATGNTLRRLVSDFGFIKVLNYGLSGTAPTIGGNGTAVLLGGENNTVRIKCHRARFLDDAYGGTGVVCAGLNNTIASGSEIVGYRGTASNGNPSYAIDVRAGSITTIDCTVRRCNVVLKWGSSDRWLTGRIFYTDNNVSVEDPLKLYSANASLVQRSNLEICSPFGSSKQSCWGSSGSVSVTNAALQNVTITGLNLPYVPIIGEVGCFLTNTNKAAQAVYAGLVHCHYIPDSSSTTTLSFRVMVDVVANANGAAAIRAKLN